MTGLKTLNAPDAVILLALFGFAAIVLIEFNQRSTIFLHSVSPRPGIEDDTHPKFFETPSGSREDISAGGENNIFFLESNFDLEQFHPRLLCAFESAAVHNPRHTVHVILHRNATMTHLPSYLKLIPNLSFLRVDFGELFAGTPMEVLWTEGKIQKKSGIHFNNISDTLRAVLVYLFGGTYFDSDFIITGPIPDAPASFIGAIEAAGTNNALLKFTKGHGFLLKYITRMVSENLHYRSTKP